MAKEKNINISEVDDNEIEVLSVDLIDIESSGDTESVVSIDDSESIVESESII